MSTRPEDREILGIMEDFYLRSASENQSFWAEASIDARFESGDQSVWNELYHAPLNRQQLFGFNRIRRIISMIDGHQRQNRKSIIATPIENGDQATADQFTKIIMWLDKQEHVLDTVSDAFRGALISGMNMLQVWVDYSRDPINGDIKVDNCSYNTFLVDPFFKKADMSDCSAVWKRSYLTHTECAALLPAFESDIFDLPSGTMADGKFAFMPESRNLMAKDLLAYDEYYYRSYRKQKVLIDTQSGEVMEWRSTDEDSLKEFLRQFPQVITKDQTIPSVSLAVVVQGRVFYNDINPLGDNYPFIPVFAYFRPDLSGMASRVQSVTRGLRDPQYLYNRRRLIELDQLEAGLNGGLKYKEGALVDDSQAYQTGQGKTLIIKQGYELSDVEQLQSQNVSPSSMQISEILARELQEISGVSEAALGIGADNKSGYDTMLKQAASLVTIEGLFDSLQLSETILGNVILNIVQNNYTPGKVKRICSDEPTPEFYNKNFGKYDCVMEMGFDTSSQKALAFAELLHLREAGVQVPDATLLDACTVQNKDKLIKDIESAAQQQQAEAQKMQEIQAQEIQMRSQLAGARVEEQLALARARDAKAVLDVNSVGERLAEARKDETQAKLNYVKELETIDSMRLESLQKLVELSKMLDPVGPKDKPLV